MWGRTGKRGAGEGEAGLLRRGSEAEIERAGAPMEGRDVMIAAAAIGARLPVVTGNTAHFAAVQRAGYSLQIENWRAEWLAAPRGPPRGGNKNQRRPPGPGRPRPQNHHPRRPPRARTRYLTPPPRAPLPTTPP